MHNWGQFRCCPTFAVLAALGMLPLNTFAQVSNELSGQPSAIPATSVLASLFQLPRKPSNDFTTMKPNLDKIDDAVLALLYLTSFTEGKDELALTRAWKSHDWDALDRLHKKGLISDPKKKAKSVVLSQEGRQLSEEVFRRLFCE